MHFVVRQKKMSKNRYFEKLRKHDFLQKKNIFFLKKNKKKRVFKKLVFLQKKPKIPFHKGGIVFGKLFILDGFSENVKTL
jgi:hypothetical protein